MVFTLIVFEVSIPGYQDIVEFFRRVAIDLWNHLKGEHGPVRITLRLIVSLFVGITLVAWLLAYSQVRDEKRALREELERRAAVLGESLAESFEPLLHRRARGELQVLVGRFGNRENLAGVEICDDEGKPPAMTPGLENVLAGDPPTVKLALTRDRALSQFLNLAGAPMHVYARPLTHEGRVIGALVIFHHADYIEAQNAELWRNTFLRILVETLFIALTTLLIIRWSVVGPIAKTSQWMRELRTGKAATHLNLPEADLFQPLTQEVTRFARSLKATSTCRPGAPWRSTPCSAVPPSSSRRASARVSG